jgi:hypothetical protein
MTNDEFSEWRMNEQAQQGLSRYTLRLSQIMKRFTLLILCLALLASCQLPQDYRAGSVAEARAYAQKAVQAGVIHKGGELALIAQKSAGQPMEGKWNPAKIDRYIARFVAENPSLVKVNLAATQGKISEKDRVLYTRILEREKQMAAENLADTGSLNRAAGDIPIFRNNSALMQGSYPDLGAGGINGMGYY